MPLRGALAPLQAARRRAVAEVWTAAAADTLEATRRRTSANAGEVRHDDGNTTGHRRRASTITQIESAIGLNWYDADPNLQQLVERLAAPGRPRVRRGAAAPHGRRHRRADRRARRDHRQEPAAAREVRPLGQRGQRRRPPPERDRDEARPVGERLHRPALDRRGAADARRPPARRREHGLLVLPQPGGDRHALRASA